MMKYLLVLLTAIGVGLVASCAHPSVPVPPPPTAAPSSTATASATPSPAPEFVKVSQGAFNLYRNQGGPDGVILFRSPTNQVQFGSSFVLGDLTSYGVCQNRDGGAPSCITIDLAQPNGWNAANGYLQTQPGMHSYTVWVNAGGSLSSVYGVILSL